MTLKFGHLIKNTIKKEIAEFQCRQSTRRKIIYKKIDLGTPFFPNTVLIDSIYNIIDTYLVNKHKLTWSIRCTEGSQSTGIL